MITAILKDKRGFETKIKIAERLPQLSIPLPITPEIRFNVGDDGYSLPTADTRKEQVFYFEKMIKKRTALYLEK